MFSQPYYSAFEPSPYLYSPYYHTPARYPYGRSLAEERAAQKYARILAEQRARRAQYLPEDDEDNIWQYDDPRKRVYLDAQTRQDMLKRMRKEEVDKRQRALNQQQEALDQSQKEEAPDTIPDRETLIPLQASQSEHSSSSSSSSPSTSQMKPQFTEYHEKAASRIQKQYRIHHSIRIIRDLETNFQKIKEGFVFPETLDFQNPGFDGIVTVPSCPLDELNKELMNIDDSEGKLAYTSANYAFHAQINALDKLLVKLDGVESWGNKTVRERRREVVKRIEEEAKKMDVFCKDTWRSRHVYASSEEKAPMGETETQSSAQTTDSEIKCEFESPTGAQTDTTVPEDDGSREDPFVEV